MVRFGYAFSWLVEAGSGNAVRPFKPDHSPLNRAKQSGMSEINVSKSYASSAGLSDVVNTTVNLTFKPVTKGCLEFKNSDTRRSAIELMRSNPRKRQTGAVALRRLRYIVGDRAQRPAYDAAWISPGSHPRSRRCQGR